MGVEEGETVWLVVGEDIDGNKKRRMDYMHHKISVEGAIDLAEKLMRDAGIIRGRVYVYQKVAEQEIELKPIQPPEWIEKRD